jgi:hypothetical protein
MTIRLYDVQLLGSQITITKKFVIIIAGNVRIQIYIRFCKIINSAEQSTHQLLVMYIKLKL